MNLPNMTPEEEHEELLDYISALTGQRYDLSPSKARRFADSLDHYHSEGYDRIMSEEAARQDNGL